MGIIEMGLGFCVADVVPSPKFQLNVELPGALGVEVLLKLTNAPGQTAVSLTVKFTVGS